MPIQFVVTDGELSLPPIGEKNQWQLVYWYVPLQAMFQYFHSFLSIFSSDFPNCLTIKSAVNLLLD